MALMSCRGHGDVRLPLTWGHSTRASRHCQDPDPALLAGNRAKGKEWQQGAQGKAFSILCQGCSPCTSGPCLVTSSKLSSEAKSTASSGLSLFQQEREGLEGLITSNIKLHLPRQAMPMAPLEGRMCSGPHSTNEMSQIKDKFPSDKQKT